MSESKDHFNVIGMDDAVMADGERMIWSSLYTAYYMKSPCTGAERAVSAAKAAYRALMMLRGATAGHQFSVGNDESWHAMAEQMLGVPPGKLSLYAGTTDDSNVDRMAAYHCSGCGKRFGHDDTAGEPKCPFCDCVNGIKDKIRVVACSTCQTKYEGRYGIPRSVCTNCGAINITGKIVRGGPICSDSDR